MTPCSQPLSSRRLLAPLAALLLALALHGCGPGQARDARQDSPDPAAESAGVPVEVQAVLRGRIAESLRITGLLEADLQASVTALVGGEVLEEPAELGDPVVTGQTLARLDPTEADLDVKEAEQNLEELKARVTQRELDRDELLKRQEQAIKELERAAAERDRQESLWERRLIAESVRDEARTGHDRALLEKQTAELALQRNRADLSIASILVSRAQVELERAKLTRRRHDLVAPIPGVVSQASVRAHDRVAPGAVAYVIVDSTRLLLPLLVPETSVGPLSPGQQAWITTDSRPGRFAGTVTRIAPTVSTTSGTVRVEVSLDNSSGALLPGMFVTCTVELAVHEEALLVPKAARVHDSGVPVIFLVEEGLATRFPLAGRSGLDDDESIEIIAGLEEGQLVVVVGQSHLQDGCRVELVEAEPSR